MSAAEALNTQPGRSQHVILVVDDETGILEFLRLYLHSKSFQVFTANSAEEALRLWPQISSKVDLIITDVLMPGLDGKRLSERLTQDRPDVKFIYMSGYLPDEFREEKFEGTFFRKPFHPQELLAAIQAALL